MTFTEEQVEWIVMEVVRRLRAMGGGVAVGERSSTTADAAHELRITERVITLRSVEGRLGNALRVVVQPRAVVTPAVKDELKQRKIELIRRD
jgi:hypothetical protein